MEEETSLPVIDQKAQYDAACKRVLSEKIILAWIMKSCLDEYRDCTVREIVERYIEGAPEISTVPVAPDETNARIQGVGGEDASVTEGTVTYDIRFQALAPSDGEPIQLVINVEAQNDYYPGYPLPKRAIYYCCRLISAQYGTVFDHAQYEKLQKVYSIWICMNPPKNRENTITAYHLTEKQLVGNVQETIRNYDLLSFVMICLGNADSVDQNDTLKMLDTLFSTGMGTKRKQQILQDEFDITMTHSLESEVLRMCNLSEGVERRGIEKGIKQGIKQNALSNLQALMSNTGWSLEQAMTALNIPDEERVVYADLLKES